MNLITAKLEGLSTFEVLQQDTFQSANTGEILNDRFEQINDITPIDRLFFIDKKGTSEMNAGKKGFPSFIWVIFIILNGLESQKDSQYPCIF